LIYGQGKCPDCGNDSKFLKATGPGKTLRCPPCFVKAFISLRCCHTQGEWAKRSWEDEKYKDSNGDYIPVRFRLLDWQHDVIEKAFSVNEDGKRTTRFVYLEIPKKNGKTEFGAALALYMLIMDDEPGAEIYSAAGDIIQAGKVYQAAAYMVAHNDYLSNRLQTVPSRKRIIDRESDSFYAVRSSEVHTAHGINPHCIVFDELHAQPNRELYDVLVEGTDIARPQQLIFVLTTAGIADKEHIAWQTHHHALQIVDGIIEDPKFTPILYCIRDEYEDAKDNEDWEDPEVWKKLNPSLGNIFELDSLETHYKEAKQRPERLNNFLRYRLNKWVGQYSRWLPMDRWDACGKVTFTKEELMGRRCCGGLDLSSHQDLSAFVLVFPPVEDGEKWKVLPTGYIPKDAIEKRVKKDGVPYDMWVREGWLKATPGRTIDQDEIRRDINKASKDFKLLEVAYDRWGADKLVTELEETDGITMVMHGQGYKDMNPPMKHLFDWVTDEKLAHNNHAPMRWCADNLAVEIDGAENVKPRKDQSSDRIDLVVALVMALGRAIKNFDKTSKYEDPKSEGLTLL
jgi:phage terminase large subunit-like protein